LLKRRVINPTTPRKLAVSTGARRYASPVTEAWIVVELTDRTVTAPVAREVLGALDAFAEGLARRRFSASAGRRPSERRDLIRSVSYVLDP
jgi:hypothetical protein